MSIQNTSIEQWGMNDGYWILDGAQWHHASGKNLDTDCGIPVTDEHMSSAQPQPNASAAVCTGCESTTWVGRGTR